MKIVLRLPSGEDWEVEAESTPRPGDWVKAHGELLVVSRLTFDFDARCVVANTHPVSPRLSGLSQEDEP